MKCKKCLFIFLLLMSIVCETYADNHVVFDLDWTLILEYHGDHRLVPSERLVHYDGTFYVVREGASELVESLLEKGIQVSFFSGGSRARNEAILSQLVLKNGKSFKDVAFKMCHHEDLTPVAGISPTAAFHERYKKDLFKIVDDLNSAVLVDDDPFFALPSQKKNLLALGPTYFYFNSFEAAQKYNGEYVPKSNEEWRVDKYKLKFIQALFTDALNEIKESKGSFRDQVFKKAELYQFQTGKMNAKLHEYLQCQELISGFW